MAGGIGVRGGGYGVGRRLLRDGIVAIFAVLMAAGVTAGCFGMRSSKGGGQVDGAERRRADPADVAVLDGYTLEVVARGLTFPTALTFDAQGKPYVVESGYAYGEVFTTPQLLELREDGNHRVVAKGDKNGPWNGVAFANDGFFVSEGGVMQGGRILRVSLQGEVTTLVKDLPSWGDHHTNALTVRDGWIYFGQGTATNAAVVGPDNEKFGWLKRFPQFHDVPCKDVELNGENYASRNVLAGGDEDVKTGPYLPFGTAAETGQVVPGTIPCSGAILRVPIKGGDSEVVAWGFRNPFGIAFDKQGQLYTSENGFDVRGSRPIFGVPDVLWRVQEGSWYGWPDFAAGIPVSSELYDTPDHGIPKQVLARHPGKPPQPVAKLAVHSSSNGFDISHSEKFGFVNHAFIAQFGDQAPDVGKVWSPVGYKLVMVDLSNGLIEDFAVNRGKKNGPASLQKSGGLERPISARFDPSGQALYLVDFGVLRMDEEGAHPQPETGLVWRIRRTGASR